MKEFKNICIRMPNWIGDAIMALPALKAIQERYKESKVSVVCPVGSNEIYQFIDIPFHRIVTIEKKKTVSNSRKIKKCAFDCIIYFTNSFSTALEGFLAGIKERVGYKTDCRGFLLTIKYKTPTEKPKKHHSLYYLDLASNFTGIKEKSRITRLKKPDGIPPVLINSGWVKSRPTLGINPGAAYGSAKRWLPERFRTVASHYLSKGFQVVVFSGKGEELAAAKEITQGLDGVIDLSGKTGLSDLIGALARCDIFLTNDSGPMHIAAALDIPLVALFGPTDPVSTSPVSGMFKIISTNEPCSPCFERKCPLKHHNCMKNIDEGAVINALTVLEKRKK